MRLLKKELRFRLLSSMNKFVFILLSLFVCVVPINAKQHYVVLPKKFAQSKVVVVDTPEYKKLLQENKELKNIHDKEKQNFESFQKKTDELLIKQKKENERIARELSEYKTKLEIEKQKSKKSSWLVKLFGLTSLLFPIGGALIVVLCILNPAVIPVLINFFVSFVNIIVTWISFIFKGLKKTADKIALYKHE